MSEKKNIIIGVENADADQGDNENRPDLQVDKQPSKQSGKSVHFADQPNNDAEKPTPDRFSNKTSPEIIDSPNMMMPQFPVQESS